METHDNQSVSQGVSGREYTKSAPAQPQVQTPVQQIVELCLLAGKIMLQNGAETYRVEDTMTRIAQACGTRAESFVMPTGIVFSVEGEGATRVIRVHERGINLRKVTLANSISRSFCEGSITLTDAYQQLRVVDSSKHAYRFILQVFAAALTSGCFLIMFQGIWADFLDAVICGALGFSVSLLLHRVTRVKFFSEFIAALGVGLLTAAFMRLGLAQMPDKVEIASVMPLVPGLLITNAVRDLMAGHLVSGTSKGIEALLTALAIGGGIATTLAFL